MSAPASDRDVLPSIVGTVIAAVEPTLRRIIREEIVSAMGSAASSAWMTKEQVAELLGYDPEYISELVRRQGLPGHQPGGPGTRYMFERVAVDAWIKSRKAR